MRYFLELSYNGTNFHGWQVQPNASSVQAEIENALCLLLQDEIKITGAGRTDAGVHARQMFAHFDVKGELNPELLTQRLNSFLPNDISIKKIHRVKNEAHARFDAISRSYTYHIHQEKNPFLNEFSWYYGLKLDINKMNQAAEILLKHSDFKSFSKSKTDVKTYICKIEEAFWEQKDTQLTFYITADRFLRNMVRAVVGTLINVGINKISVQEFEKIIITRDRSKAGFSVPAKGLFLTKVNYPQKIFINGND